MDTSTKTGIDAAKTASIRVVQKNAEDTGDLTGNKRKNRKKQENKTNLYATRKKTKNF